MFACHSFGVLLLSHLQAFFCGSFVVVVLGYRRSNGIDLLFFSGGGVTGFKSVGC
ncbi:unnamed protein product [Arabidopsis halleri]